MSTANRDAQGLLPLHIGLAEPGTPAAAPRPHSSHGWPQVPLQERSPLVGESITWAMHGAEPRWLGHESGDCAAALEPGIFSNRGDAELRRFITGAAERGETALLVSTIGHANSDAPRNPLATSDASVNLPQLGTFIGGSRLPAGARPRLGDGLDRADRDLALRLLNRPPTAWWTLKLRAPEMMTGGGHRLPHRTPDGHLHPILVDIDGAPVVAAWTPSDASMRWYVLPDTTDWNLVVDWLVRQALPLHVPAALRRARHATFIDLDLQTADETRARTALADLDDQYARRKAELEEELREAAELATPVRDGLLYGGGDDLAAAVAHVLTDAGVTVTDLDHELGATESADLLATGPSGRKLIEVKSANGAAGEHLVDFLRKHLETWPSLRPDLTVDGGVLIVNHQRKLAPQERTETVYSRKAFTDSLPYPVLSTRQLYDWWRAADWQAVHDAVFGPASFDHTSTTAISTPGPATPEMSERPKLRGWRRGR